MSRAPIGAFEATVLAVDDLSPSFRRVTFGGQGLQNFGPNTHPRDLRIKLVIPPQAADSPQFDLPAFLTEQVSAGVSWYQAWLQVDPALRGAMRTYTVREWNDADRRLVVDMVVHTDEHGHSGPAAQWAESAEEGQRLHIIGPARTAQAPCAGIEFAPGGADQILLAGDETAVPAIASILDSLQDSPAKGKAVLEVPSTADIIDITAPAGFEVEWLPRGDADFGQLLEPAVREAVRSEARIPAEVGARASAEVSGRTSAEIGARSAGSTSGPEPGTSGPHSPVRELDDVNIDEEILWDVPAALTEAAQDSSSAVEKGERPFYAWIAGEAGPVKRLRRYLVQEVGVDRKQIAFMGYWRQGRAEG